MVTGAPPEVSIPQAARREERSLLETQEVNSAMELHVLFKLTLSRSRVTKPKQLIV